MKYAKPVRIKAKLFWTKEMTTLGEYKGKKKAKYECTLGEIRPDDAKKLQEMGVTLKSKAFAENVIVCKSKFPFIAADKDGKIIESSEIGNGSDAEVLISTYTWEGQAYPCLVSKADVPCVIVTNLVTYVPPEEALDDIL
jgi:hypothetical protein